MKSYMVIFNNEAPASAIDEQIKACEQKGGKVTQRFDGGSILKGFAASMPDEHAQSLQSLTEGGKHEHM